MEELLRWGERDGLTDETASCRSLGDTVESLVQERGSLWKGVGAESSKQEGRSGAKKKWTMF